MLKISNLTVKFKDNTVLDNYSCDLSDSRVTAICGPSGRGKTTLLNVIAGFVKADEGQVKSEYTPVYMFQKPRLFPYLTALENVNVVLSDKKETLDEAKSLLMKVGFYDFDKYPDQLSGGMQQRVALARTLAGKGDLLLLDEPFASLDKKSREELLDVVLADGRKVIFVTHNLEDAKLADKIIELQ
jgi:ABC-type nitrate/sulfonate/bicarbonate transport system ATPase subunit